MSDQIRVNGTLADGAITIKLDGIEYYGFTGIGYDDGVEVKKMWGLNKARGPRGRTAGKYDASDGSLKGPKSTIEALFAALDAKAPFVAGVKKVSLVEFPLTVAYADGVASYLDRLNQVRVLKRKSGVPDADSADGVVEELTLSIMSIFWNGKRL